MQIKTIKRYNFMPIMWEKLITVGITVEKNGDNRKSHTDSGSVIW